MINRRHVIHMLGAASVALSARAVRSSPSLGTRNSPKSDIDPSPPLAAGAPSSPERTALIDEFLKRSEGLQDLFEPRQHKGKWVMPYRLFRPRSTEKLPVVMYLHGSGGLGDDNLKQLSLGNRFGTRVWLLPENQNRFPCYVVAPQTDRGWIRYDFSRNPAVELPGFGEGSRLALEVIGVLCREFNIDTRRIYIAGNSMGGAGVWNLLANSPNYFAAAVICCGGVSPDDGTGSFATPLWDFHGDADEVVPVASSRNRIAARRRAGGHPLYTEYAGADHNAANRLGFTEPGLPQWLFANRRA